MAEYKGSPVMQRLIRRQKIKEATTVETPAPTPPEKKDGDKQTK
jgi:hypothetical protein